MRDIDWSRVPEGPMVVLTAEDTARGEPLKMADFKDTHALFYKVTGSWLALSRTGVRLGKGPMWMEDGIWMCSPDEGASERLPNHDPDLDQVCLRPIA